MSRFSQLRLHIAFVLGGLCVAAVLPVAAQPLSGVRGELSTPRWLSLQYAADIPVRTLLADTTYSESFVSPSYVQGPLRTYQDAESARSASLASHGLTTYKGLRLEGRFRYQKSFRDGIGWKLGRQAYHHPYYFANIKPGDWDNDRYALDLRGGTSLLGDHLLLALGADYQIERLARYNDPRPSINYYNLFLEGQVGVRLGRHTVALYAGSGDAEENGVVGNYNRAHNSFGEQEYNIITTTGMGSYNLVRFNAYKKPSTRSEIGVTYDFDREGLRFTGELVGRRSKTKFTRQVSGRRQTPGRYHERSVRGTAFVTVSRPDYTLQARSTTQYRDGYDYNEVFAGANYFHTGLQHTLDLFYHTRPDKLTLQARLDYSSQSFTDRNASHQYEYGWLAPGLSGQYSIEVGARRYTLIPGMSYRLPLAQRVQVLEKNRNLYTSYVLSPDYYLHTSGVARLRGGIQVLQQFGGFSVGLLLDYRRRMVLSEGSVLGRPDFLPGNVRNTVSLTLQFFH